MGWDSPSATLATLPEVADNGGFVPGDRIDVFAAREIYASTLPGIVPDCNPKTGGKVNPATNAPVTGTPTDNAPILNAFLANPTGRLVIDAGYAIGAALIVHAGNAIVQLGDRCGLYILPGSNCNGVQNFAGTDLATNQAWSPSGSQAGLGGSGYWIENLYINGNRGTYPNGNCDGSRDGTLTGHDSETPDARGPYPVAGYWLSGIILVGANDVHINGVKLFDIPTYGINLYHCVNIELNYNRCDAGDPTFSGNTDFFHFNGGCANINGVGNNGSVGDDVFGINADEGDGSPISDVCFGNTTVTNCQTVVRVYGRNSRVNRVQIHHLKGTGIRFWVAQVGLGPGQPSSTPECSGSVEFSDWDVLTTFPGAGYGHSTVYVTGSAGVIELNRIKHHESSQPIPMVLMDTNSTISSLRMNDCSIHRNGYNNAATFAVYGSSGTIGDLWINGFRVTQQAGQTYADIPILVDLVGTTVGHITIGGRFEGVGNILNISTASIVGGISVNNLDHVSNAGSPASYSIVAATAGHSTKIPVSVGRYTAKNLLGLADPSSDVALTGPGLVSSGFDFPDAMIAPRSIYFSSTLGGPACKDASGTSFLLGTAPDATAYTLGGPSSGTTGVASTNFVVTPNGTYSGAITPHTTGTGTFSPTSLTWAGVAGGKPFTYTATVDETATISTTSSPSLTDPATKSYASSSSGVTTYFDDTFIGTPNSALTGRVPSPTQSGSNVYTDLGNAGLFGALGINGAGTACVASSMGSANVAFGGINTTGVPADHTASLKFNTSNTAAGVIFRPFQSDDASSFLLIAIDPAAGNIGIGYHDSGSDTLFSGSPFTFATSTGSDHVILATRVGSTITVKFDGATVASSTTPLAGNDYLFGQQGGAAGQLLMKQITTTSN